MADTDTDTDAFDSEAWRAELERHRVEKDEFFADHPQSPLPAEDKSGFDGLAYYPPDPEYRVEAELEPVDGDDSFEMEMTAGEPVEYVRVARIEFDVEGDRRLYAYRQADDGEGLFVPFRDATSGTETYGAGRYLELHPQEESLLETGGTVTVDFNLAYAPFCAYNDAFACPIPPAENQLDVAVEAGERLLG
jgi:uncharacterized protein (DUF1684 family)